MKILCFSFIIIGCLAYSQQQVNRTVVPNTLSLAYDSTSTLFPVSAFWGEMQKGFASEGESMNSNIRFGGLLSFHRWKTSSLDFNLSFELTADPYNDIAFNPRSARWQEELFLTDENSWGNFQYGLMHRCKHEIDNFDPEDTLAGNFNNQSTYRVTLSSGPFVSWMTQKSTKKWNSQTQFRSDFIIMKGDYRFPENEIGPSWEDLLAELSVTTLNEYQLFRYARIYNRNWINIMQFANSTEFNFRLEIGLDFMQKANSMQVYFAAERLYDDLMLNIPRETSVFYIGFRGSNSIFW